MIDRRARVIEVDPARPDPAALAEAAAILQGGGLVAFPTETVYGLGCDARSVQAVRRLFAAKGRPAFNPLIVHVADVSAARALVRRWPPVADRLAEAFWPGPLTLVLPKVTSVPDEVTAGLDTVALRVPAHPVALALLRQAALPVAAPSANRYTSLSPTTAAHVLADLGQVIDLVLDGGPTTVGIESTVVDLVGDVPRVLRPGQITLPRLLAHVHRAERADPIRGEVPRPSPGMVERHYAPKAALHGFESGDQAQAQLVADEARRDGRKVGALLHSAHLEVDLPVRLPPDAGSYARELYAALHGLDDLGCDLVMVEQVPGGAAWEGVRDRLRRAGAEPG